EAAMVAVVVFVDVHVTCVVRSDVDASVNVPVAVNGTSALRTTSAGFGDTAIETSCGGPTVSDVEPTTEPKVALMVVGPIASVVARPCAFAAFDTSATVSSLDVHST